MNPNITKIIDQYLTGELSPEDKAVFEERMANNPELQEEVRLQKSIMDGAERATDRVEVKKAGKKYHYKKLLKWSGISAVTLAIATAATMYVVSPSIDNSNELPKITKELKEDLKEFAQLENLPIQYFPIAKDGGVVLSDDGVLLSVPKKAFMLNGKPYEGQVVLQYQEAISGGDIVKSGLSTMTGDRLLETQGMFGVAGFTADGKALDFNPKVGVYVQTPVDEYKDKMQLYDGVKKADGTLDWQNPEPLEKLPVPVDMSELDFYPRGYEDFLDQKKWNQTKKSRDSLYLSMEGDNYTNNYVSNLQVSEGAVPQCKITVEERDYLYGDNRPIDINMTESEAIRLSKWKEGPRYNELFKGFKRETYNYGEEGDTTSIEDIASAASVCQSQYYLAPSKVLAFWKKKFNNTNLATREFEKRVEVMHTKCFQANSILEKYTSQLNKPMREIDNEIASMGHPEFTAFAAENIGVMNSDNPHLKGLQAFYEKAVKKLKEQNKKYQDTEKKRQSDWDKDISKERTDEAKRKVKREADALNQEFNFNMRKVRKHFGYTVGFTIRRSYKKGNYRGVRKNIDRLVYEATVKRQTTTIVDPQTGKKIELKYNKFSLEVENGKKYIKLFTYLFPNKINSYQRIPSKGGKFKYTLNNDIIYDIAVVGITEDGYDYFQKMSIKGGELGTVKLDHVSEAKLDASIKQLNGKRMKKPARINDELKWLIKERKDYKEQKVRKNMAAFRESIKCVIFTCHSCATVEQAPLEEPDFEI